MSEIPTEVDRTELPFEPTHPWVYYCQTCGDYLDPSEVRDHLERAKERDDHDAVTHLQRVEVTR